MGLLVARRPASLLDLDNLTVHVFDTAGNITHS